MRIVDVSLRVRSSVGASEYSTRFGVGLNVIRAPNSWGKSTLLQSIVYALGLEGALSASRRSPLGPAMTTVLDTEKGRGAVIESWVTVTLANDRGQYLRARRAVVSPDVSSILIQTWTAGSEDDLDLVARKDMFVRDPGGAVSVVGFHRLLEEFLGWSLPDVPNFAGGQTKLYLEILVPLSYVEQKFGWSGIAPRVPTHYRVRSPLQRSVEYVLGFSVLERLRLLEALKEEESEIRESWAKSVSRASEAARAGNLRISIANSSPIGSLQRQAIVLDADLGTGWLPVDVALGQCRERLESVGDTAVMAGERTEISRAELSTAEQDVRQIAGTIRDLDERLTLLGADSDALASRLASIEADRRRLRDLVKVRDIGGELELPLIAEGRCPTCQQTLDDRDVATGNVSTVDENVSMLESERRTLLTMQVAALQRMSDVEAALSSANSNMLEARARVRLLKDELVGPSGAPSLATVQERLRLEERIRAMNRVTMLVGSVEDELDTLAQRLDGIRVRRAALGDGKLAPRDATLMESFRRSFREQLAEYGLRSLPSSEVTIDEQTYLPVHDGFELSFDVAMGISASDTIRTKWAYHIALLEASRLGQRGHHFGVLVLDEPNQQQTERPSLAAFLRRLQRDSHLAQIIYATSEDPDLLDENLRGLAYTRIAADGVHVLS
jgi:hypothetical protein